MRGQENREQRAGFYSSHPDLLRAGIELLVDMEEIWTPAHLNRDELLKLSLGIVSKLDRQLEIASRDHLKDFIVYYSNSPVIIGSTSLVGQAGLFSIPLYTMLFLLEDQIKKSSSS